MIKFWYFFMDNLLSILWLQRAPEVQAFLFLFLSFFFFFLINFLGWNWKVRKVFKVLWIPYKIRRQWHFLVICTWNGDCTFYFTPKSSSRVPCLSWLYWIRCSWIFLILVIVWGVNTLHVTVCGCWNCSANLARNYSVLDFFRTLDLTGASA